MDVVLNSFITNQVLEEKKVNSNADITELETKIDFMVYKLWGLTHDEVTIDSKTLITKQ